MAIAFVNSGAVATITSSYTVGSGSNRLLLLAVVGGINVDTVSAATYAGASMTLIAKLNTNGDRYLYLFYLLAPTSGSNAFSITDGGNFNNGFAADYTGVKQSLQPDASGTNANTATATISKAVTTVADNCWLVSCVFGSGGSPTLIAGANTTIRTQAAQNSAIADSNTAETPPGSFSQAFNFTNATSDNVMIVASLAPALTGNAWIGKYR